MREPRISNNSCLSTNLDHIVAVLAEELTPIWNSPLHNTALATWLTVFSLEENIKQASSIIISSHIEIPEQTAKQH